MALRRAVAKIYGGATCHGEVCDFGIGAEKKRETWQAQHTDGDASDYNITELREVLVE